MPGARGKGQAVIVLRLAERATSNRIHAAAFTKGRINSRTSSVVTEEPVANSFDSMIHNFHHHRPLEASRQPRNKLKAIVPGPAIAG